VNLLEKSLGSETARARSATGSLAFDANPPVVTATQFRKELDCMNIGGVLESHGTLDLLKDDLALSAFQLENLLMRWEASDVTGTFFMLPLVALNLAPRNPAISVQTRMQRVDVTSDVFFKMAKLDPQTGKQFKRDESSSFPAKTKTFWSRTMCIRVYNLCIALYWAIGGDNRPCVLYLGLGRIGTHAAECDFGMSRSALRGEVRWPWFLSAQVNMAAAKNFTTELNLHPDIRRFKSTSGCTVDDSKTGSIDIEFQSALNALDCIQNLLRMPPDELAFR
jgi:hypothetical protein